ELDGVRIAELKHDFLPLHFRAVADADDVELALEALAHALDVVRHERAHEAVERAGLALVVTTLELHDVVLDVHGDARDDGGLERALGALHDDRIAVLAHFHAFRQGDLFLSDTRHGLSLPDLAEHFATDA